MLLLIQSSKKRLFLLRRALGLLGLLRFRLVVILPLNDAALLLFLRDAQAADLQASMLQQIRLDLVIGGFPLNHRQVRLVHVQFDLDILRRVAFG